MNDFTKEELEEIREIARHCSKQGVETKHNLTYHIQIKAEDMIKYLPKCDHRSGMRYYYESGEVSLYPTDIYRCRYCDILFRPLFNNGVCTGHEDLE